MKRIVTLRKDGVVIYANRVTEVPDPPAPPHPGRAIWSETHRKALRGELTPAYMAEVRQRVSRMGICDCLRHWDSVLAGNPVRFEDQFAWSVEAHNAVNGRLGKPDWSVETAREFWSRD